MGGESRKRGGTKKNVFWKKRRFSSISLLKFIFILGGGERGWVERVERGGGLRRMYFGKRDDLVVFHC